MNINCEVERRSAARENILQHLQNYFLSRKLNKHMRKNVLLFEKYCVSLGTYLQ